MSDLEMLRAGIYRKIGRHRKRTLLKRGERVWFSPELQHFVWAPSRIKVWVDDLPGTWHESDLSGGWTDSCNQDAKEGRHDNQ